MSRWLVGLVVALLCASSSQAAPYLLKFQNPGPGAYASLRTAWGTVAAPCAAGATCSVAIDAPPGQRTITAEASDGATWSPKSNAITVVVTLPPAECLGLAACRFDADSSGTVTVADFAAFLRSMGSTWWQ